ncbi:MAG: glycosyltransferase [Niabella sp.]
MQKKILFDLTATQPNKEGNFHGGGKYAKKVFLTMVGNAQINPDNFFTFYDSNEALDPYISQILTEKAIINFDICKTGIREIINERKITLLYSALPNHFSSGIISTDDLTFVSTIHGLRFLETRPGFDSLNYVRGSGKIKLLAKIVLSKWLNRKFLKYYSGLVKNTTVITVSNHSKYSILSYFNKYKNKAIQVFYSPDVTSFSGEKEPGTARIEYADYFLLVSGNRWVKNNLRSMLALDELFTENSLSKKVIVTGVADPPMFLSRLKNKDKFIFLDYVDEDYLLELYKNAFCFIYMSLNEGFGYPPLEAMKFDVPVISCPFTSITEICGEAVLYADPYSVKEIKNRILWLLNDEQKYAAMKEKGQLQYRKVRQQQDDDLNRLIQFVLN